MIWYQDPSSWDVPLATSGPSEWARVAPDDTDLKDDEPAEEKKKSKKSAE